MVPRCTARPISFDVSPVWLVTNEGNVPATLRKLVQLPSRGDAFLGVGALSSLDMAARRKRLKSIYLFDCAEKVETFWRHILPILKLHREGKKAFEAINETILRNPALFSIYVPDFAKMEGSSRFVDALDASIRRGESFLADDGLYGRIHRLACSDAIVFHRVDLSDPVSAGAIERHFSTRSIDLIYFSNIPTCLPTAEERSVVAGLRQSLAKRRGSHLVDVDEKRNQQVLEGQQAGGRRWFSFGCLMMAALFIPFVKNKVINLIDIV